MLPPGITPYERKWLLQGHTKQSFALRSRGKTVSRATNTEGDAQQIGGRGARVVSRTPYSFITHVRQGIGDLVYFRHIKQDFDHPQGRCCVQNETSCIL